jgi:O-antigen ligase
MTPRRKQPRVINVPDPEGYLSAPCSQPPTYLDEALFFGTLALLFVGVLAFGATEPWGQFAQRMLALVLLGLWVARQYSQGSVELAKSPLYLPSILFVALIVLQFVTGSTSYRYDTLCEGLNLLPCGVLLLVTGDIFSRRRRLHNFVSALAAFGFLVALAALVQDLSGTAKIYGLMPVESLSASTYGPYANHNHYAGLMEMLIPLAAAAAFLERGAKRSLLAFAVVIMAMSVVFSRSRGGLLGLGVAVVFLCAMLFRMARQYRAVLAVVATVAVVAILTLGLASGQVLQRFSETQDSYRLAIYRDCLHMWLHKPVFGFGWGTFATVYPQFRSFYTNLRVNHAHNDYLELLIEMGVAGVAISVWFLVSMFRSGFQKLFDRNDEEGSVLTLGAMTGVVALLAHSVLDFNLHIAANEALFYSLCFAAATPFRHRVRQLEFVSAPAEEEITPIMADTQT